MKSVQLAEFQKKFYSSQDSGRCTEYRNLASPSTELKKKLKTSNNKTQYIELKYLQEVDINIAAKNIPKTQIEKNEKISQQKNRLIHILHIGP